VGDRSKELVTYLPASLVRAYQEGPSLTVPWCRPVDGTMVMADLSGFTSISERLAKLGDEGAERLTTVINSFFERMLKTASFYGGDTLTFGGDAILLLFQGEEHADRGVAAALGMLKQVERAAAVDAGDDKVKIGMSVGGHSDTFLLAAAGLPETEVRALFLGRGAESTALAEAQADRGQVAISPPTKKLLKAPTRMARAGEFWRVAEFDAKNVCPLDPDETTLSDQQAACLAPFLPPYADEIVAPGATHLRLTPEHRRVAIVFVNILGLNDLIEGLGVDGAMEQLQGYVAQLTLLSEKHRGFVVSSDIATKGSKLILTFGAPVAHEYAAANAARFALDLNAWLRDAGLDLQHRIGVNGGHVFAGEVGPGFRRQYTVMGDAVNLAARLMAAAPPGEVYVSRDLLDRAGSSLCGRELPPMKVKGKEQPVAVCVLEEEKRAGRQVHLWDKSRRRRARLFGRRPELALIHEKWQEALDGSGSAVLVEGDAGVGKTRLIEEALRSLSDDAVVVRAACFEHLQAAPFAPWVDVLHGILDVSPAQPVDERTALVATYLGERLPDLVEFGPLLNPLLNLTLPQNEVVRSLDGQARREKLFELLTNIMTEFGPDRGRVILVEDLHWMDETSMDLVGHLVKESAHTRILVLFTTRPGGVSQELDAEGMSRIVLAELTDDQSLAMVREALDVEDLPVEVGEAIYAKTKGNPLFLEEVIHSLQAPGVLDRILTATSVTRAAELAALEIPDRVQGLLMSRIDRLPPDSREVLKAGSVVGRSFSGDLLKGIDDPVLAPISLERALGELVATGLVLADEETDDATVSFRHALVQDVAYDSLPFARRRDLHWRVARHLEATQLPPDHAVLVHHYQLAGDSDKTRVHAVRASESSVAIYASLEAVDFLGVALKTVRGRGPRDACLRSRFEELMGDSLETLARTREAVDCYGRARRRWISGKARSVSEETLRELSPIENAEARESLLCWKMAVSLEHGLSTYRRALSWIDKATEVLPPGHATFGARLLLTKCALLYRLGLYREAVDIGEEGLALARQGDDLSIQAYGLNSLGCAFSGLGLLEKMHECYKECAALYEQVGDLYGLATSQLNLGFSSLTLGLLREAIDHGELSLSLFARIGNVSGVANQHMNLGGILMEAGDLEAAFHHLEEAIRLRDQQGVQPQVVGYSLILLSRARVLRGDLAGAEEALAEGRALLQSLGSEDLMLDVGIAEGGLHLAKGDLDLAERDCLAVLSMARSMGAEQSETEAMCLLGRVKVAQGEPEDAVEGLEACVALAERLGADYERAQALRQLAEAQAACSLGDPACEELLTEAIGVFERMGAARDLRDALELRERLKA
jgi:class 3 adenylate cyclase/tetratricopeptide (TPR) repeat protein